MPTVSNIIEIDLSTAIGFKVESHKEVHQWDQGIMLQFSGAEITAGAVCQFDGKSTTHNMIVDTSLGQVAIPNAILGDDLNGDVKAHLQFKTEDYQMIVYDIHIPVIRRVKPATYLADPDTPGIEEWIAEQVSIIEQDKADIEAMGATASVDANVGTPSVTVTKTGGSGEPVSLDFEFHNLKGVQGEQGIQGPQGPTGPQGPQGPAGPPLPVVTSSDEGKVLTVDDQGDWVADDAPTGLPDVTSADSGKVLTVDQNGSWVPAPPSGGGGGTATFTGQGAPTSAIVASVGDFYRDTLTDKLYQCSQYISPSGITDLAGLTVVFANSITFTNRFSDYLNFTSNGVAYTSIWVYDDMQQILYVQTSGTLVYGSGQWSADGYRTVTFTSGNLLTNSDFISWVLANASIEGVGSTWVEVAATDDRLPDVSVADNGAYLKVINGVWAKGSGGSGGGTTSTYFGNGAPTSQIVAAAGDYYWDTANLKLYICTAYVVPGTITDLTGLTYLFNQSIDPADIEAAYGNYAVNYKMLKSAYPNNNQNYFYMGETSGYPGIKYEGPNIGGWVYYRNSIGDYVWSGGTSTRYDLIQFVDGTDIANSTLVNFVTSNAVLQGVGSSWQQLKTLPPATKTHSLLQANNSLEWEEHKGTLDIYDLNGSSASMIRLSPGTSVEVWYNNTQYTRLTTDDLTFKRGSLNISVIRSAFSLLGGNRDAGIQTFSNGSDLNTTPFCRPGNYGYVNDSMAATLVNCPSDTAFCFKVMTMSRSDYQDNNNHPSWSYNLRILIRWDGTVFLQNVYYENSGSWYFGPWNRITTSAEVPDAPTIDGTYALKCTVTDGTPVYSWVADT